MWISKPRSALALPALLGLGITGCGDDGPSGPGNFPDVRGAWTGQYSVVACSLLSGDDDFFCSELFYNGRSLLLDLQLSQSGSRVNGVADQGQLAGQVEGSVDELGLVRLSGRIGEGADATTEITAWETILTGDSLTGSWVFEVEDNTASGFGVAEIEADVTLIGPGVPAYVSCPAEATLALTDAVSGVLDAGDCQLEDESFYDVFLLTVAEGDRVEFRMGSLEFDPALLIVDLEERIVGCSLPVPSQTCSRNSPDSVATLALEAVIGESWLVIANTFRSFDTGAYNLTTTDLGPAGSTGSAVAIRTALENRVELAGASVGPHALSLRELLSRGFTTPPASAGWKIGDEKRE